jgi:hypothetical protein
MALAIEDLLRRQEQIASETAAPQRKNGKEGLSAEEESQLKDLPTSRKKMAKSLSSCRNSLKKSPKTETG